MLHALRLKKTGEGHIIYDGKCKFSNFLSVGAKFSEGLGRAFWGGTFRYLVSWFMVCGLRGRKTKPQGPWEHTPIIYIQAGKRANWGFKELHYMENNTGCYYIN